MGLTGKDSDTGDGASRTAGPPPAEQICPPLMTNAANSPIKRSTLMSKKARMTLLPVGRNVTEPAGALCIHRIITIWQENFARIVRFIGFFYFM